MTQKMTLRYPIKTAAGEIKSVTLRRAKVRDLKEAQRGDKNEAEQEIALLSILSDEKLTPEDLEELDLADYAQLQQTFRVMHHDVDGDQGSRGRTGAVVPDAAERDGGAGG